MRFLTVLLLVYSCWLGRALQAQEDHLKLSPTQTSKNSMLDVPAASATETDWAIIEIVALDLLKNKTFIKNFGPVPRGQKIPRRLWINPTTLPFLKIILEGTNADYFYFRDQRGPKDAFDIPDAIRDNLVQRNQIPVSIANFKPKNHSISIGSPVKEETIITALEFMYTYPNTGFMASWLPGFSKDGRQALLRFTGGPTDHGMDGTYMLMHQGNGWKIKWRYVNFR